VNWNYLIPNLVLVGVGLWAMYVYGLTRGRDKSDEKYRLEINMLRQREYERVQLAEQAKKTRQRTRSALANPGYPSRSTAARVTTKRRYPFQDSP
jgi:hypothetical protein